MSDLIESFWSCSYISQRLFELLWTESSPGMEYNPTKIDPGSKQRTAWANTNPETREQLTMGVL